MFKTQVLFSQQLPKPHELKNAFIIYDRRLKSALKPWLALTAGSYAVTAGEKLKSLENYAKHLSKILRQTSHLSKRQLILVAVGGGSVGDFTGFVASTLHRGVRFWQIPSTWLAAIDSAHGGKTALNVDGIKNQVGTFYFAERVYLVRDILFRQNLRRQQECQGELFKMALLNARLWQRDLNYKNTDAIWQSLPDIIRAKYKIVQRDPLELKGIRHILNLGHTMGHVFESHYRLPHGIAVGQGLCFALEWSKHLGCLPENQYKKIVARLALQPLHKKNVSTLSSQRCRHLLTHDKKINSKGKVRFVFLSRPGRVFCREVELQEILQEARRQQWLR